MKGDPSDRSAATIVRQVVNCCLGHCSDQIEAIIVNLALSQVRNHLPPLRNGPIFMKDAQCAETNEKLIFQFLRFLFYFLS